MEVNKISWEIAAGCILWPLALFGVIFTMLQMIRELAEKWLKRKDLAGQIEALREEMEEDTRALEQKLEQAEQTQAELSRQSDAMRQGYERLIGVYEASESELLEIARQIVENSEALYRKLEKMERWTAAGELTPESREELAKMLREDAAFKQRHEAALAQYVKELEERMRQRAIQTARERGWEPER